MNAQCVCILIYMRVYTIITCVFFHSAAACVSAVAAVDDRNVYQ